jgi:hypothetical protein
MTSRDTTPRLIEPQIVYALGEFQKRTVLGETALRTARRNGLEVLTIGGRRFIRGASWCDYCAKVASGEIDPVNPKGAA